MHRSVHHRTKCDMVIDVKLFLEYTFVQEVFHVYLNTFKMLLLIYFSLHWVIIDFHGLV